MVADLISVIVPVYKVEPYLDECIKSISNQTHRNLEIILVDDGSPDRCPQICDDWAKKDPRVRVIHQKNSGSSAARNAGLDIAVGDYIGFVDSDDYIDPDMYRQLLCALKDTTVEACCCSFFRVFDNGRVLADKYAFKTDRIMNVQQAIDASFYKRISNAVWGKLYRRTVFEAVRFPVGETNEDYPVMVPTIIKAKGMALINKALYYYRKRDGSVTSLGHTAPTGAQYLYNNLLLIGEQIAQNGIGCKKSYAFFVARNAFDMALIMEKHKEKLDANFQILLNQYRTMLRKTFCQYIFSKFSSLKDKILCLMIITKALRLIYRILNKKS